MNSTVTMTTEEITVDSDREKRIHLHNVRYDTNKKKYIVTIKEPTGDSTFDLYDVDWNKWITFGDWQKRKDDSNYY